jgi:hypothetical protein
MITPERMAELIDYLGEIGASEIATLMTGTF